MTTPRTRSLVSFAAALTVAILLGGCASASSRHAADEAALSAGPPVTIHFDNEAHDYVHVYLVGVRRQWLLGRVESGARTTLTIPAEALTDDSRAMWLAVLVAQPVTGRVAGNARAVMTAAEPMAAMVAQRWTFSPSPANGLLTSVLLRRGELSGQR